MWRQHRLERLHQILFAGTQQYPDRDKSGQLAGPNAHIEQLGTANGNVHEVTEQPREHHNRRRLMRPGLQQRALLRVQITAGLLGNAQYQPLAQKRTDAIHDVQSGQGYGRHQKHELVAIEKPAQQIESEPACEPWQQCRQSGANAAQLGCDAVAPDTVAQVRMEPQRRRRKGAGNSREQHNRRQSEQGFQGRDGDASVGCLGRCILLIILSNLAEQTIQPMTHCLGLDDQQIPAPACRLPCRRPEHPIGGFPEYCANQIQH